MKDNFYTIPDGFLDKVASKASHDAAAIRRRRLSALGVLSALCLFVTFSLTTRSSKDTYGLEDLPDDELAEIVDIYNNDIFLNCNY